MKGVSTEESTISRLMTLGTVTYETTGWGTGEIVVKCRSNTKCEQESLNKAIITFTLNEQGISREDVDSHVVKELGKRLENKELRVWTEEDKQYNKAKKKFKNWKNTYKSEHSSANIS